MRGVILAGGFGTRLQPMTLVTNKHLLPVFNKPMIYYPINTLASAGIEDIMILTGSEHAGDFINLLGDGKEFGVMILQGPIVAVRSKTSNKPYITAMKTSVPTTLDEQIAKNMVGKTLPGTIEKIACDPYEFLNHETGKKMKLDFTYMYNEEPATIEEEIVG